MDHPLTLIESISKIFKAENSGDPVGIEKWLDSEVE
jgi:hypothetical protein